MRTKFNQIPSLVLAVAIAAPLLTTACSDRHYYRVDYPYYRDRHRWNDREVAYYNQWALETHRDSHRDFRSLKDEERKEYFTWRHSHHDHDRDRHDRDHDHDHDKH